MDLVFPYFSFLILISFDLFFYFSIFRTLGLGVEVISHTITSVTSNGVITIFVMIQDSKGLSQETTLVLSNTRELDRVPKTK